MQFSRWLGFGMVAMLLLILVSGAIQAADEFVAKKALAEEQPVVLARAELPLSPEAHPKSVQVVIRDGKSLAQLLDCADEQAAVAQTAAALGVETVNFKQEMLIAVSAGPVRGRLLKLDVSRLPVAKEEMRVEWEIQRMMERAADPVRHPVRLVLVKRFPGNVVFLPPTESRR